MNSTIPPLPTKPSNVFGSPNHAEMARRLQQLVGSPVSFWNPQSGEIVWFGSHATAIVGILSSVTRLFEMGNEARAIPLSRSLAAIVIPLADVGQRDLFACGLFRTSPTAIMAPDMPGQLASAALTPDLLAWYERQDVHTLSMLDRLAKSAQHCLAADSRIAQLEWLTRNSHQGAEDGVTTPLSARFYRHANLVLRLPLQGIMGYSSAMLSSSAHLDSDESRDAFEKIQACGRDMAEALNDLSEICLLDDSSQKVSYIEYHVREMVHAVVSKWRPRALARGLKFCVQESSDVGAIVLNVPGRVLQMLSVLIGSVIKHTTHGEVLMLVSHRSQPFSQLAFEFRAAGLSFPSSLEEATIEPRTLQATLATQPYSSFILSLAACRRSALALGGDLAASNGNAQGSHITLLVPITADEDSLEVGLSTKSAD